MATIYEVAKLAGVSPATVSRVFNGTKVSEDRERAVRKAAKSLQYTPNRTARSLRRQHSEVIALIIPDIENPYFTQMARGVEDVAQKAGYSVVLCNSDSSQEKEARYLDIAMSENMAGVIVAPATDKIDLSPLLNRNMHVVAVDRSTLSDIDCVMMANRHAGRAATQALLDAGYQRVACITGPASIETASERAEGWKDVLGADSAQVRDGHLIYSSYRVVGGREAMQQLLALDPAPDAVVAGNNLLGVGAIQVLTERGLTPPAFGVAVVGSLPFTTLTPAAVTVVRLPAGHMGTTAAQMLLERLRGDSQPARTVVLRNELVLADAAAVD